MSGIYYHQLDWDRLPPDHRLRLTTVIIDDDEPCYSRTGLRGYFDLRNVLVLLQPKHLELRYTPRDTKDAPGLIESGSRLSDLRTKDLRSMTYVNVVPTESLLPCADFVGTLVEYRAPLEVVKLKCTFVEESLVTKWLEVVSKSSIAARSQTIKTIEVWMSSAAMAKVAEDYLGRLRQWKKVRVFDSSTAA